MPYIFWIDHAKARLSLVELVFDKVSWAKIYTLNSFESFIYRYEELLPKAVVVDATILGGVDQELSDFIKKHQVPLIVLGGMDHIGPFDDQVLGKMDRIIKPMELEGNLKALLFNN